MSSAQGRPLAPSVVVEAPGRVNLIGEHVDYEDGFVLPAAIDLVTTVRAAPRRDGVVRFATGALPGSAAFLPGDDPARVEPSWARIPAAVVHLLRAAGLPVAGFDASVQSDLPVGGGLSSSAALAVATALAAIGIAEREPHGAGVPPHLRDRAALAALCREAEALGAGVRCGIMDPFASLHGREGEALLLDCRTLDARSVPIDPAQVTLVVADSGVRHALASGEYGRRREECEAAARALGVAKLRDATPALLAEPGARLPRDLFRRARHVISENERTVTAADALAAGRLDEFGRLLDESHASLRADFEVSCPELDALVEIAHGVSGVLGSRMTGGGFGGCTLTAVRPAALGTLLDAFREEGRRLLGHAVDGVVVRPSRGARVVDAA